MKSTLAFFFLFFLINSAAVAQGHTANWNPEDTFSFVKINLKVPSGKPYANSPVILKGKKGHIVKVETNKDGYVKAKVPTNDTYVVHCGEHQSMKTIAVSDFPYVTYTFKAYTQRFIYLTFTYRTPAGSILEGEEVTVLSTSTGVVYKDSTNAKGQCYFVLPFDPQFKVSVKYHDNVAILNPVDVGKEYKVMSTNFSWMGSKEKEERERLMDSLVRARNVDVIALLDSLSKVGNKDAIAEMDIYVPIEYDSTEWVQKMLELKAQSYKKHLNKNPKYLEEKEKAVLAPLYRLDKKFKHKIIVTDITGSMSPYMEQVLLWHAFNFMDEKGTKYLFFNDGDQKGYKEIGNTGGLYFCEGQFKDFKHIIATMRKGMRAGDGGDGPENDVEALIAATEKRATYDELILVADNYSTVRDIKLMRNLALPVRIILCGVEERKGSFFGGVNSSINEEYLNLALETGGSVHTVKEDLYDLAETQEGSSITLNGSRYDFINGRFVLVGKL